MITISPALKDFLTSHTQYIIASHREPDGDSVGSALALNSFLTRRGKKTILLSSGPFKRPEIRPFEQLFIPRYDGADRENTALIVLDCANIDRIGDASEGLEGLPVVVIDHHATNDGNGSADYIDTASPSTTILVQDIIESFNDTPTREEAEFLLFGLCTDTGFFRHLDTSYPRAFECTARLVAAGASPKETFRHMNGGKSIESRFLISRILSRLQRHYGGQMVVSYETLEDTAEFGLEGRDSDSLYQLIQAISGVEVIVIVRQETPENCTVGFRSVQRVDVSTVAGSFGGGGHKHASGLSVAGTIDELIPKFIAAFAPQFPGLEP